MGLSQGFPYFREGSVLLMLSAVLGIIKTCGRPVMQNLFQSLGQAKIQESKKLPSIQGTGLQESF